MPTRPPVASETAAQISAAYPPPATATETPEPGRDDAGYRPAPWTFDGNERLLSVDYFPLEFGLAGPFLARLSQLLGTRDAESLTALMGPGATGESLRFEILVETEGPPDVSSAEMSHALKRLYAAGSRPLIQGYFLETGERKDPDVSLAVVIDGWRGDFGFVATQPSGPGMALPVAVSDTVIWRFERDDDDWRWRSWDYLDGSYQRTVLAFARMFGPRASASVDTVAYRVVRPLEIWPTPEVEETHDVPSPDGRWVARVTTGVGSLIDPRDDSSWRSYRALEVIDTTGKNVLRPVEAWDGDGFPRTYTQVFAWRPDSRQLLYSTIYLGDGCGGESGGNLERLDIATGTSEPVDVGSTPVLDRGGQRLAGVAKSAAGVDQIRVLDLDSGATITGTVATGDVNGLAWSPDGLQLAATTGFDPSGPCSEPSRSGLVLFDTTTGNVRTLLEPQSGQRLVSAWQPEGVLAVEMSDTWDGPSRTVYLDAATGEERRDITPTPAP